MGREGDKLLRVPGTMKYFGGEEGKAPKAKKVVPYHCPVLKRSKEVLLPVELKGTAQD